MYSTISCVLLLLLFAIQSLSLRQTGRERRWKSLNNLHEWATKFSFSVFPPQTHTRAGTHIYPSKSHKVSHKYYETLLLWLRLDCIHSQTAHSHERKQKHSIVVVDLCCCCWSKWLIKGHTVIYRFNMAWKSAWFQSNNNSTLSLASLFHALQCCFQCGLKIFFFLILRYVWLYTYLPVSPP